MDFATIDPDVRDSWEAYEREFLLQELPDVDTRPGSVPNELLVRPAAASFAEREAYLRQYADNYSISVMAQSSSPDDAMADKLCANIGVTRKPGAVATGSVALWTSQTADVFMYNDNKLIGYDGTVMRVAKTYIGTLDLTDKTSTDTIEYRQMLQVGDRYVFVVPVETSTAYAGVMAAGSAITLDPAHSQIDSAEVASPISGGSLAETSTAMLNRALEGLALKAPIGTIHVEALLAESSYNVMSSAVFGMGDAEQTRGRRDALGVDAGGRVDAVVRTSQMPTVDVLTKTCAKLSSGQWRALITRYDSPGFYRVVKILTASSVSELTDQTAITVTPGYESETHGPWLPDAASARFSAYQTAAIDFTFDGVTGTSAEFQIWLERMPSLEELQAYVQQPDLRGRGSDLLVKAAVPVYVDIHVALVASSQADVDTATQAILDMVNTTAVGKGVLSSTDIVIAVRNVLPTATIDLPVRMEAEIWTPGGTIESISSYDGELKVPTKASVGLFPTNSIFIASAGSVEVRLSAGVF